MRPLSTLFLAAPALLAAAIPAGAAPPPPVVSRPAPHVLPPAAFTSGPVRADARRLAEMLMPQDLYLASVERAIAAGFDVSDGSFENLDPRAVDALRAELIIVARLHELASMPQTYDRYARAYASHFSSEEVAELAAFYGTGTGQKLIVGKFAGMDISGMLNKWVEDPDTVITGEDIRAINRGAVARAVEHLDKSDIAALIAFSRTPVFARLVAFSATMNALETQIASEPDAEFDKKIDDAVQDVMARFPAQDETS